MSISIKWTIYAFNRFHINFVYIYVFHLCLLASSLLALIVFEIFIAKNQISPNIFRFFSIGIELVLFLISAKNLRE